MYFSLKFGQQTLIRILLHDSRPAVYEPGEPPGVATGTPLGAGGGPVALQGEPYRNVGRPSLLAKKSTLLNSRT